MQKGLDRRGNVLRLIQGYCVVQAAPTEAPSPVWPCHRLKRKDA